MSDPNAECLKIIFARSDDEDLASMKALDELTDFTVSQAVASCARCIMKFTAKRHQLVGGAYSGVEGCPVLSDGEQFLLY